MIANFKLESLQEKKSHLKSLMSIPSISARDYSSSEEYFRLDFINHPDKGMGLVDEIISDQMIKVFFLNGEEELEHKLI